MSWQFAYVLALLFSAAVGLVLSRKIARALLDDSWAGGLSPTLDGGVSGLAAPPLGVLGLALIGIVAGVGSTWYAATLMRGAGPAVDAPDVTATDKVEVRGVSAVQRDIAIVYRPKVAIKTDARIETTVVDAGSDAKLQRVWFLNGSVDLKKRAGTVCAGETATPEIVYACAPVNGNRAALVWYVSADDAGEYELIVGPKERRPLQGVLVVNGELQQPGTPRVARVNDADGTITLPLTITNSSGLTQWQQQMVIWGGITAGALLGPGFLWVLPWFRRFKKQEDGKAGD